MASIVDSGRSISRVSNDPAAQATVPRRTTPSWMHSRGLPGSAPAIPESVISRPPSAELRPDQSDQDSLPPYEVLDAVLTRYVEQDWSITRIVDDGFDETMVRRVAGLVLLSEYKRRQAPPGVRVTHRAFGRDRRYPITSGWVDSEIK